MKGIVVHCPRCRGHVDLSYESKFHIFDCSNCAHRFRGIYADNVGVFDGNIHRIIRDGLIDIVFVATFPFSIVFWPPSCKRRGNNPQLDAMYTSCPHCTRKIDSSAKSCPECTQPLPWYPAGEWRVIPCSTCGGEFRAFDWAAGSKPTHPDICRCQSCNKELLSADLPAEFACRHCGATNCADINADPNARCNWCKERLL